MAEQRRRYSPFEYEGLNGAYIANNFFDKGDSGGKFALIFNGGHANSDITVEYNTFIGPMKVFGGAAVQWHTKGILRYNLLLNTDPLGGVSALASFSDYSSQISHNDFVGYTEESAAYNLSLTDLAEGNRVFGSLEEYRAQVTAKRRSGSSIF